MSSSKPKLIVASARLPVTMSRRQDGWEVVPSTGGLVTALKAVAERRPFTWLGWPGTHVPESEHKAVEKQLAQHGSVPVYIGKSDITGFYEGVSNRLLWPLFHNLGERTHFDRASWRAYQKVNSMFAEAIAKVAEPNDVVWVHDYQLALVPEMLRRRGITCPIGFFLHIPFPSAETYRTLPVREEILRGILGADLVGFHAYEYVSHFRSSCLRVLGIESEPTALRLVSHQVNLAVLPIGIDPIELKELCESDEAVSELASLRKAHGDKRIVVGVDRLDYTKGIPEKLLAFGELLRSQPRWRNKTVLVQIAAPSRTGVAEYQALKREVDEIVGRINGKYGTPSSVPIVYINQAYSRARLMGLYKAADVALITPVRDGMNLVALEYVAARRDKPGTLILSEFAGAAHCLPGARLVSPYNINEVSQALAEALDAKAANPDSFGTMLEFVDRNTSMVWANRFLDLLEETLQGTRTQFQRLRFDEGELRDQARKAEKPLVLLDYDGTLRSFVLEPSKAVPDQRILDVVEGLAKRAHVYVISGRAANNLEDWLGHLPIGLVCEHGLAIRHETGEWMQREKISLAVLKRVVEPLLEDFVRRTPGSRIERKSAAVAWHYRAADPEFGAFQANQLMALLEDTLKRRPFNVLRGNRVIEVRHESTSKGRATQELLKHHSEADFLFVAGDDRTDEEMMDAIPKSWRSRAITCWVGGANRRASYWVESNRALLTELEHLTECWKTQRRTRARRR